MSGPTPQPERGAAAPMPTARLEQMSYEAEQRHCEAGEMRSLMPELTVGALVDQSKDAPPPTAFFLPSGRYRIKWAAEHVFSALASLRVMFVHAGAIVEIASKKPRPTLVRVTPPGFQSRIEHVGEIWKHGVDNKGRKVCRPTRCSRENAEALLASEEALRLLPPVETVAAAPILTVDRDHAPKILGQGHHYDLGGVYVGSDRVRRDIPLADAIDPLLSLISEFNFATPADKARAVAAILTPAFTYGRLLGNNRIPAFLMEANKVQSGKGYLVELIAAIYGEVPTAVKQRKGGVGSFDEDFDAALLRACPFIVLDNLRGQLDSPSLESFLTDPGLVSARPVCRPQVEVDARRYIVFATSNKLETTDDFLARLVRIGIRKQRPGYRFSNYPGHGDVLGYVRAHQTFYLGCVFSILMEWIRNGCLSTDENRHSFYQWAQALDWILQEIFSGKLEGRLLDYDADEPEETAQEMGFLEPDSSTEKE
jgi:hypothetical protein